MSNFQDTQAELKKQFLGFLIGIDFQCSELIYNGQYAAGTSQMHRIASTIYSLVQDKSKIKTIYEKLTLWLENAQYTETEIRQTRKELSEILADNFYSDLHISVIPTSVLKGEDTKPENKPISPNQSSRI
jgi:hypothetical protein